MKRLLIGAFVGVGALVVGIAIAVASSGGSDTSNPRGAAVSIKAIGGVGKVLVDAKGRALYVNDQEHGMALCTGSCLSFWKPLTVVGTPKHGSLPGKLAVAKRPDGGKQVTYDGKLLYAFTLDKPGKVTGDNFKDAFGGQKFTWHVARPTKTSGSSGGGQATTNPYPGY
jgi:predicted lipoprotein with Yx(FWY)xxD motif